MIGKNTSIVLSDQQIVKYTALRDAALPILAAAIKPAEFNALERRVRDEFRLDHRWTNIHDVQGTLNEEVLAAKQVDGLAQVFLFHGDGRVREAAMGQVSGPLISPAQVYALFWRMNDWAAPVRLAAERAVQRCLPVTPAAMIADAIKVLLPHVQSWKRWSAVGPETLTALILREDVSAVLLDTAITTREANLGPLFRELGRGEWLDPHLERTFRTAKLPHIRVMALDALLSGTLRWPVGQVKKTWTYQWHTHSRMETVFETRAVTVQPDPLALLQAGMQDKASLVRKRVADGIISLRHDAELREPLDQIADVLRSDPNIGVRGRIAFYDRQRAEADA